MPTANLTPRAPTASPFPDTVLDAALTSPWALSATGMQKVLAVASRSLLEADALRVALEQRAGEPLDNTRTVTIRDGVATIPVRGVMVQRGGLFSSISGATSYATLARDLREATDNPQVRAILLAIDSPGGEVAGCHELFEQVLAVRGVKPIVAYIGGDGCSAAYWIASGCDRIHAAETAVIGSLGVLMSALDDTAALRAEGYRRIEIVSSQTPAKHIDPATEDGRSRVQRMVDDLAAVFLQSVATGRGTTVARVTKRYGTGEIFVGARALAVGLVDSLSTYDAVHAELARPQASSPRRASSAPRSARVASNAPVPTSAVRQRPAVSTTRPRTVSRREAAQRTEARAERRRILGILAHQDANNRALIEQCIADPSCTPAMARQRALSARIAAGHNRRRR